MLQAMKGSVDKEEEGGGAREKVFPHEGNHPQMAR